MNKAKVLIVDDKKVDLRVLRDALEMKGYQVEAAEDAFEALKKIPQFQPDLITIDQSMPRMSGIQFLEKLKSDKVTADIPVIFITIFASKPEVKQAAIQYGARIVSKPLDIDELRTAVQSTLSKGDN